MRSVFFRKFFSILLFFASASSLLLLLKKIILRFKIGRVFFFLDSKTLDSKMDSSASNSNIYQKALCKDSISGDDVRLKLKIGSCFTKPLFLKIFSAIVMVTISLFSPVIVRQLTLGFKVGKIFCKLRPSLLQENTKQIPPEISEALSQRFVFLDKGAQCYVFESSDKNYVLKLFKHNNRVFKNKSSNLPMQKFISSCEIAEKYLSKQTGVVWVHMHKTEALLGSVQLENPLGEKFILNLNDCMFVFQKKVKTFNQALSENIKAQDYQSINRKLESFFNRINDRLLKSIENADPNLSANFGFLDDELIEIDVGNFLFKEQDIKIAKKRYFELMQSWMQKNHPDKLILLERFREN